MALLGAQQQQQNQEEGNAVEEPLRTKAKVRWRFFRLRMKPRAFVPWD